MLQVMALVAMEQPLSFTAEHITAEKLKVLQACRPLEIDDLVTGQYVRAGKHPGYLEDGTIENKQSTTETFATAAESRVFGLLYGRTWASGSSLGRFCLLCSTFVDMSMLRFMICPSCWSSKIRFS